MLVSQNEMKKNGIDLSVVELENKFMQLGHEVEGVTSFENDKLIVGYVETCENHPNADKLNVAKVNLGKEVVQIVCGASNICAGIFVIVAINGCKLDGIKIKKVELKGIESNGMICSLAEIGLKDKVVTIEDKEGIFIFDFSVNPGDNALEALGLKDNILELSLTANRGDCLSYVGLVRDISALVKSKNKYSFENVDATINNTFTTKLSDESSTLLSSMLVENIVITPSPSWLKIWLAKIDIKSQNLIVDLASYVMFTLGTPIHTYDAAKISGGIKVINLDKSTKFIGLDELEYNLKPGNLVIEDDEKIVSLASVLGSNQTKVTNDTTNILIEIGIFNPVSVRKTATVIGKKTDASIRGEKNIDHHQIENAYNLFCTLLKESNASAKFSNVITKSNEVLVNSINLKFSDVNKIVGIEIPKKEIISNLEKLQFLIIDESDEHLIIQVPSWRFDIKNNHDLIEEVIRIYSMEKIETKEVMSSIIVRDKIIKNPRIKLEREMEASLINLGLNQIMTYSLVSEEELVAFGGDLDIAVELMMPLSSEHQYYRQSLLPSALKIAKYNLDRQQKTVNICEIGNCYTVENNIIKEEYFVAGVLAGVKTQNYNEDSTEYNFYDAKYVVESLLTEYNLNFQINKTKFLIDEINPYVHADIIVDDIYVGFIGAKHPNYYKKIKQNVFFFEINLSLIESKCSKNNNYTIVSQQPVVQRDLTIFSNVDIPHSIISSVFDDIKYIKEFECIGIYDGDRIEAGRKSTTFRVVFGEDNITLDGEEVDKSIAMIIENIKKNDLEFKTND